MAKADKKKKIAFIRTSSINDLARYACRFDQTPTELIRTVYKGESRIIAPGETVDGHVLFYYTPSASKESIVKYIAGFDERVEFTDEIDLSQTDTYYMSIVDAELSGLISENPEKISNVAFVKIGKADQLVRTVIKKAIENENIEKAYSFSYKGKAVLGAFDLFDELDDEQKIFYYTFMDSLPKEGFIRYDYSNNKMDFSNEIGEHSYMYAKKIELAEPFPFFNLE
ncbi:MAG: hypothetical protein ACP5TK_00435 [Candidatus Micrarchaeia archaeon]